MRQDAPKLGKHGLRVFPSLSLLMAKEAEKMQPTIAQRRWTQDGALCFGVWSCGGWAAGFNRDVISGGR